MRCWRWHHSVRECGTWAGINLRALRVFWDIQKPDTSQLDIVLSSLKSIICTQDTLPKLKSRSKCILSKQPLHLLVDFSWLFPPKPKSISAWTPPATVSLSRSDCSQEKRKSSFFCQFCGLTGKARAQPSESMLAVRIRAVTRLLWTTARPVSR